MTTLAFIFCSAPERIDVQGLQDIRYLFLLLINNLRNQLAE
jgi:hypothetical protein